MTPETMALLGFLKIYVSNYNDCIAQYQFNLPLVGGASDSTASHRIRVPVFLGDSNPKGVSAPEPESVVSRAPPVQDQGVEGLAGSTSTTVMSCSPTARMP